jgi:Mn-containing catalase
VIEELLVEELRDILSAEGQLVKALPKIAKAANTENPSTCFRAPSRGDQRPGRSVKECFTLLGAQSKAKPCKRMAGLLEEGDEVIEEGKEKDDVLPISR